MNLAGAAAGALRPGDTVHAGFAPEAIVVLPA